MAKSITKLLDEKQIRRGDALKAPFEMFIILDGFNGRVEDDEFWRGVEELAWLIVGTPATDESPERKPIHLNPLEIKVTDDDKLRIIDGHRRMLASMMIVEKPEKFGEHPLYDKKVGKVMLPFFLSTAETYAEEMARIVETQDNAKLSAIELGRMYQRIRDEGHTLEQVGRLCGGKSKGHVEQMLKLFDAPPEVRDAIQAGKIGSALAVEIVRQHGEAAPQVIEEEHKAALEQGKDKITKGTMAASAEKKAPAAPKVARPIFEEMAHHYGEISSRLSKEDRVTITEYQKGIITEGTVSVDVGRLLALELAYQEMLGLKADIDRRQREKEDKAKQTEIE